MPAITSSLKTFDYHHMPMADQASFSTISTCAMMKKSRRCLDLLASTCTWLLNLIVLETFLSQCRFICNTSGSGKTRRMLEGLTKYWGLYMVATPDINGVG